jgi:hypothetical protein
MLFLVRNEKLGSLWPSLQEVRNQAEDEFVGNKAEASSDWYREKSEDDRVRPLSTIEMDNVEGFSSHIYDHDLTTNHDGIDGQKEPVVSDPFKYIELVVETTITKNAC